jgi:hypothetical protein
MSSILDRARHLSSGWFAAAAGAAAAGAALAPKARILAGAALGLAVLGVGLWTSTPPGACCDDCAAGKGCGGTVVNEDPAPSSPTRLSTWDDMVTGSAIEAAAVASFAPGEPSPGKPPVLGGCRR